MKERACDRESGQVFLEAVLWLVVFAGLALAYFNFSRLEYLAYRRTLGSHDFRAVPGSHRSR
jgi:hypothetical protein